jgi:hypothetical protein
MPSNNESVISQQTPGMEIPTAAPTSARPNLEPAEASERIELRRLLRLMLAGHKPG